jgi:UDP-hydrolysing UDP-N-acetyl-D-glucosamine 2-epimerase
VRNALTKLSHLHFTPTEISRQRVVAMGEEAWRVHRSGAPSLDHLVRHPPIPRVELEAELGVRFEGAPVVVAYHPVTLARDTLREVDAVFGALESLSNPIFFCFPNADAGSRALGVRAREFCAKRADARLFVNLNPTRYWGLLRYSSLMLGNSSSGIMETPSLELPTVNVGMRQKGRERATNIVDAEPDRGAIEEAIQTALAPDFRKRLSDMVNPYGDGHAAERIVAVLAETCLGEALLHKKPAGA